VYTLGFDQCAFTSMLSTKESAGIAGTPCALILKVAFMIQIITTIPKRRKQFISILIRPKMDIFPSATSHLQQSTQIYYYIRIRMSFSCKIEIEIK
jgi:hypothetical protein